MQGPEKNSYKEFDKEKKFLQLENSPPPPNNFSNGPSLISEHEPLTEAHFGALRMSLVTSKPADVRIDEKMAYVIFGIFLLCLRFSQLSLSCRSFSSSLHKSFVAIYAILSRCFKARSAGGGVLGLIC